MFTFYACFYCSFYKSENVFLCFYLQINVFNIYGITNGGFKPGMRVSHPQLKCVTFHWSPVWDPRPVKVHNKGTV